MVLRTINLDFVAVSTLPWPGNLKNLELEEPSKQRTSDEAHEAFNDMGLVLVGLGLRSP